MPAPRLLDKKSINASLALERKQEIDKGVKIAKAVDALKEERIKEEQSLEQFRRETVAKVQQEIDSKILENNHLTAQNKFLKEERIRLEAPIDLSRAWQEVNEAKAEASEISSDLLRREIDLTTKENDIRDAKKALTESEKQINLKEASIEQNLYQAQEQREQAALTNNSAQATLTKIELREHEQNRLFIAKAKELEARENSVAEREEIVQKGEIDINNQKILLADQRATLERGFAELRRKQDGLHR